MTIAYRFSNENISACFVWFICLALTKIIPNRFRILVCHIFFKWLNTT